MGAYLYLSLFYIKCNQILDLQCPQAHLSSLIGIVPAQQRLYQMPLL